MTLPESTLPLLFNDDSYFLSVDVVSPSIVRLRRVVRFRGNQNVEGEEIQFFDLDDFTRRAIVQQINRRYIGRTVRI